jgi:hypothetical protein
MKLDDQDQEAMEISKGMSPDISGSITSSFDSLNGMFIGVSGNLNTIIETMGLKMVIKSKIEMKKKK